MLTKKDNCIQEAQDGDNASTSRCKDEAFEGRVNTRYAACGNGQKYALIN